MVRGNPSREVKNALARNTPPQSLIRAKMQSDEALTREAHFASSRLRVPLHLQLQGLGLPISYPRTSSRSRRSYGTGPDSSSSSGVAHGRPLILYASLLALLV